MSPADSTPALISTALSAFLRRGVSAARKRLTTHQREPAAALPAAIAPTMHWMHIAAQSRRSASV